MKKSSNGFIIAIDGPSASGKTTTSSQLAKHLNGYYLISSVVFRCIGLACQRNAIDTKNEDAVLEILKNSQIIMRKEGYFLNGEDVSKRILEDDMSMPASNVSVFGAVRETMTTIVRQTAENLIKEGTMVVTEGRDMGTTVFPNAEIKIYLTASIETRAERRYKQNIKKGRDSILEAVLADIKKRDKQDTERAISPLVKDPENYGYFILDNTELSPEETLDVIMSELKKRELL